ncbi:MAG: 50S ribosomal protein L3 [Elusimicrobiota bacterium]
MIQGLLGKKVGMSRWFDEEGNSVGITLISCGPCYIVDSNGAKIKIGFSRIKESRLTKAEIGQFKKKELPVLKYTKEVLWYGKDEEKPGVGEKLSADVFEIGERIDVQGKSKGKGFTGVMKRWGFKGGPGSHGSRFHRVGGSIGQASSPSRVFPGLKMPGRKGYDKVTVKNLEIVAIDIEENIVAVRGAVPGPGKGLLFLQRNAKNRVLKK